MIKSEKTEEYLICIYLDENKEEKIGLFKKTEEEILKTNQNDCYDIIYTDIFSKKELCYDSDKTFTKKGNGGIFGCKVIKIIPLKKIFPKNKRISIKEIAIAVCEIWKQTNKEELNIESIYQIMKDNIDKIKFIGRTENTETIEQIGEKYR